MATAELVKFYDPERDGVSQSLLGMFLECRQKARLNLLGWTPKGTPFAMTNGTIGHACLQYTYEGQRNKKIGKQPTPQQFKLVFKQVEDLWRKENPSPTKRLLEDLEMALMFAEITMPIYFDYWKNDFTSLAWEKLEGQFRIPYKTADGRKTFVRGKMDGVFKRNGIWLFESKFKGLINEADILDTLSIDLQVMLYLWALGKGYKIAPSGVLYNVVRRPGLKINKKETLAQFGVRVKKDIEKRPDWYFYRFEVKTEKQDIARWSLEFEDLLVDFLKWWAGEVGHYKNSHSCISKYGRCQFLAVCSENQYYNLVKRKHVFNELAEL